MKNQHISGKRILALAAAFAVTFSTMGADASAAKKDHPRIEYYSGTQKDKAEKSDSSDKKEDSKDEKDKASAAKTGKQTKASAAKASVKKKDRTASGEKAKQAAKKTASVTKKGLRSTSRTAKASLKKNRTAKAAPEPAEEQNAHYIVHIGNGTLRLSDEYQDYTYDMCVKYGIEDYYQLILTQMCVESGYNPSVISPTRNYGLMQISMSHFPTLQRQLGLTDLRDPKQNIEAGVYMMAGYLKRYGDAQLALVCYNCGESAARRGVRSNGYSSRIVTIVSNLEEA